MKIPSVLHPFTTNSFEHTKKVLQPGEPTASEWTFSNKGDDQPLQFRLTLKGEQGSIKGADLEFNNSFNFELPEEIEAGYSLVCNGTQQLRIYDQKGRYIKDFDMGRKPPLLRMAVHNIRFDCTFVGNEPLIVNLIIKQEGAPETIIL